jgi:hypothetical protein
MPAAEVTISQGGRGGFITYREGTEAAIFEWEIGGSVLALIWGTKKHEWDLRHPWAKGRQGEIYNFVASEVVRQKAQNSAFEIELESGMITLLLSD